MKIRNLIVGIALGVALSAGILVAMKTINVAPNRISTATVLPSKSALPEFSALDHNGTAITEKIFKGRWNLVFFGFTHCPDVCPLTLQVLAAAQKQLRDNNESLLPRIVLVSVDPERDSPERMARYIGNFGDDILGITGDLEQIKVLASGLFVFFEKRISDDENYSVDHSAVVLVIGPDGQVHAIFGTPHKIENFTNDLPLLMHFQS